MENPKAIVDEIPTVRSLFAKFERINDPLLSSFISAVPGRFSDLATYLEGLNRPANKSIMYNRSILNSFALKFHKDAGTLTSGVEQSAQKLCDPNTLLLVSTHQPNLFAYSGVFKKIVLLETLKRSVNKASPEKSIVNIFLIVDHDFIDEVWVRLAQLPSIQHSSGILDLRFPVPSSQKWQMVHAVPPPGRTIVENWKKQIRSWIKKLSASGNLSRESAMANLDRFWPEVEAALSRAKSYADFNSFIMSRVVNSAWEYDTLFVRLSEISAAFKSGYEFLVSNSDKYSETLKNAEIAFMRHGIDTGVSFSSHAYSPLWLHCTCGSKAPVRLYKNPRPMLAGQCMSCKRDLEVLLSSHSNPDLSADINRLSPRAIPIPLLLSRDLQIACYASGTGGIGYLMDMAFIAKKLSIDLPQIAIWPSRDIYCGIGQADALAAMHGIQEDIDPFLQRLYQRNEEYENRIRPLIAERSRKNSSGEPMDPVLEQLFALKEEQRLLRKMIKLAEKVRNAVNLSPCFIDYLVNFGVSETEKRWRTHLLQKDNLALPVLFDLPLT